MRSYLAYALLVAPILGLGIWQYIRNEQVHLVNVESEMALAGAQLLREWCGWLATISTASIGASFFVTGSGSSSPVINPVVANVGVASFGLAVFYTATLLLALPSLVLRLKTGAPHEANDLYEATAFLWVLKLARPLFRVGYLAFAQYYFFVVGVVCFVVGATRTVCGP